ncbi:MAG: hypothetical protein HY291_20535 [Planctomycetes bacterium]|nr:hypothetical protein [Planctomycetota bacterium]
MADAPSSRRSSRFSMRSKQIGQLLQEANEVKAEHIAKALKIQEQQGGLIGQILRSMGVCKPSAVRDSLLKQVQVTDIHCEDLTPEPTVLGMVSKEQCETDKLCPFEAVEGLLCIVMGNPLNRRAINAIEEATKVKVKPFKAPWPKIKEMIDRSYTDENMAAAASAPTEEASDSDEAPAIEELDAEPPAEIPAPDFGGPTEAVAVEEPAADEETPPEPESQPEDLIEGLDTLNDGNAEVIETDGRGLTRKKKEEVEEEAPKPKAPKIAKVNVNLDELDLNEASEVVGEEDEEEEEQLEEITGEAAPAAAKPKPAAASAPKIEALAAFSAVPDAYFYEEGAAPEEGSERTEELLELIQQLPVAEVVAESAADYRAAQEKKAKTPAPKPAAAPALKASAKPAAAAAPAKKEVAVEHTAAPKEPVTAVALSDSEFNALVAALEPDPVGEWDWQYAAPGPVLVEEFETEAA